MDRVISLKLHCKATYRSWESPVITSPRILLIVAGLCRCRVLKKKVSKLFLCCYKYFIYQSRHNFIKETAFSMKWPLDHWVMVLLWCIFKCIWSVKHRLFQDVDCLYLEAIFAFIKDGKCRRRSALFVEVSNICKTFNFSNKTFRFLH